jgi:hypothetical protein
MRPTLLKPPDEAADAAAGESALSKVRADRREAGGSLLTGQKRIKPTTVGSMGNARHR